MIRVGACDGRVTKTGDLAETIGLHDEHGDIGSDGHVYWVDVLNPTDDDWKQIESTFHFHPLAIEDAKQQGQRSKVDVYPAQEGVSDSFLFLSIRFWVGEKTRTDDLDDATKEMDIFLGPRFLITIHNGESAALKSTWKRWQEHPLEMPQATNSAAYLLYLLLDAVVDDYLPIVDELDTAIDELETAVYETDPTSTQPVNIKPAIRMKKRLLLMRQTVTPLRDMLNQLLRVDEGHLIPSGLRVYYQDVFDHTLRLVEQVDLHRDILSGVLDAGMAQTSNRMNQVMKTLTVISTVLMSTSLIAGIYGMNVKNMWGQDSPYGFDIILGVMVLLTVVLIGYFRRIKWL